MVTSELDEYFSAKIPRTDNRKTCLALGVFTILFNVLQTFSSASVIISSV
jgi:hypothetical protein